MGSAGEAHTPAALPPPPKAAVLIPSLPALKVAKAGGGVGGDPSASLGQPGRVYQVCRTA